MADQPTPAPAPHAEGEGLLREAIERAVSRARGISSWRIDLRQAEADKIVADTLAAVLSLRTPPAPEPEGEATAVERLAERLRDPSIKGFHVSAKPGADPEDVAREVLSAMEQVDSGQASALCFYDSHTPSRRLRDLADAFRQPNSAGVCVPTEERSALLQDLEAAAAALEAPPALAEGEKGAELSQLIDPVAWKDAAWSTTRHDVEEMHMRRQRANEVALRIIAAGWSLLAPPAAPEASSALSAGELARLRAQIEAQGGRKGVQRWSRLTPAEALSVIDAASTAPALLAERDVARAETAYWKEQTQAVRSVEVARLRAELEEAKRQTADARQDALNTAWRAVDALGGAYSEASGTREQYEARDEAYGAASEAIAKLGGKDPDPVAGTLRTLLSVLHPFSEAARLGQVSGRPPFEFCSADDYAAALSAFSSAKEAGR